MPLAGFFNIRLVLMLDDGLNVDRVSQCLGPEARIIHDFVGGSIAFWSRQRKLLNEGAVRLNGHHLCRARPRLRMPNH